MQTQINNSAVATTTTPFSAAVRFNSGGKACGRRLSFVQEYAAGDVRKALKEQGIKGKALTAAVDKVLRGDSTMGWACFEASVSAARSKGFVPVVADLNKAETKLTVKLERPTVVTFDKEEVMLAAKRQLTDVECLRLAGLDDSEIQAVVAAKAAKAEKAKAIETEMTIEA